MSKSPEGFDHLARAFHWLSAFIVLGLLILGFWMVEMPHSPFKFELYGWHKSFGMTVLCLPLLRLLWRLYAPQPGSLPSHTSIERGLSKTIRIVLYVSLVGMPLSGWLMSSAGEFPNVFFGLFKVPALMEKSEGVLVLCQDIHALFAYGFIGSLTLHIAGALKHHIVDKDTTLTRMGGGLVLAGLGALLLMVAGVMGANDLIKDFYERELEEELVVPAVSEVQVDGSGVDSSISQWVIDPKQSAIDFTFTQYGQDISGRFESWAGEIYFDPETLAQSHVRIEIETGSIKTGSADRDEQAEEVDWFSAAAYPNAIFESESFRFIKPNHYHVTGFLTLRGLKLPVDFPFVLEIFPDGESDRKALLTANLILNRLDFGIGQGQWLSTEVIGGAVHVSLKFVAQTKL